jgi:hypothetical protein
VRSDTRCRRGLTIVDRYIDDPFAGAVRAFKAMIPVDQKLEAIVLSFSFVSPAYEGDRARFWGVSEDLGDLLQIVSQVLYKSIDIFRRRIPGTHKSGPSTWTNVRVKPPSKSV